MAQCQHRHIPRSPPSAHASTLRSSTSTTPAIMASQKAEFIKVPTDNSDGFQTMPTEPSRRLSESELRIEKCTPDDAEKIVSSPLAQPPEPNSHVMLTTHPGRRSLPLFPRRLVGKKRTTRAAPFRLKQHPNPYPTHGPTTNPRDNRPPPLLHESHLHPHARNNRNSGLDTPHQPLRAQPLPAQRCHTLRLEREATLDRRRA